jgi:hypothetical protein
MGGRHRPRDPPDAVAPPVDRLAGQATAAFLTDLAAAALATIAAHQDGEPDPLSYLRDELRAQGYPSHRSRR